MASSKRKKILVAVDGSQQALEAVRYVSLAASPGSTDVVVFHVVTRVPESFWDMEKEPGYQYRLISITEWEQQQQQLIQEFMEEARKVLLGAGFPADAVKVDIHERQAGIARDIVAESLQNYDAVVLGRRGVSELKDMVLGSIATKLVEKIIQVPIWVVGGKASCQKFLLCVDNSEGAMLAVDHLASMLEGRSDAQVTLFHAIRGFNVFQQVFGRSIGVDRENEWKEKEEQELAAMEKALEPVLDEAQARLTRAGLDPAKITRKVVKGVTSRAGAILEEAEREGIDTIVIGRRGLSKVKEFFMGRVSNKVIQMAKEKAVWIVS